MTLTIPDQVPESFAAGDTVEFTQIFSDYPPSDGWTLSVRLILDTPIAATVTTDAAQTYTVLFAASATAALVTESVTRLIGYVTGSGAFVGQRYTVIDQYVRIWPNLATATTATLETTEVAQLALVEAQITELLGSSIESYSIGQRSAVKRKLGELRAEANRLKYAIWRQQNPGKSYPQQAVRFASASQ